MGGSQLSPLVLSQKGKAEARDPCITEDAKTGSVHLFK
jgi:hypothetical protein